MRSLTLFLPGLVALALATPAAADCPNIGLTRAPVTLVTKSGSHTYQLEQALSPENQECGLMFRAEMPRNVGMVFPFSPPRDAAFWMRNTILPLDLIFVGPNNRVVSIGHGKPYSEALIPSGGITASVIELNAGEAARIGLKKGDRVKFGKR